MDAALLGWALAALDTASTKIQRTGGDVETMLFPVFAFSELESGI